MISKFFKSLAAKAGLNLYNHKDKLEFSPPQEHRYEPRETDSKTRLLRLSRFYFEKVTVQDQYIKALNQLLDSVDEQVALWDQRFGVLEEQLEMHNIKKLHAEVRRLKEENAMLIKKEVAASKPIISENDVNRLLYRLRTAGGDKEISHNLHNFLMKIQREYDNQHHKTIQS